jgi:hypothetical protein
MSGGEGNDDAASLRAPPPLHKDHTDATRD